MEVETSLMGTVPRMVKQAPGYQACFLLYEGGY